MKKIEKYIPYFIIGIGIVLRVREYLANRSLWVDEAFIALNIIHKSYTELAGRLDYLQHAPFSFLWIERAIVQTFGTSEFALRLFPLVCGIAGLVCFYRLSDRILDKATATMAILLFAISDVLVYYSGETKQYSLDMLISILLYIAVIPLIQQKLYSSRTKWTLCLIGIGAILLIQPAIFILAGFGCTFAIAALRQKNYRHLAQWAGIGAVWLLGFSVYFFVFERRYFDDSLFLTYWQYVSLVPTTLKELWENITGVVSMFTLALGTPSALVGLLAFGVGAASFIRKKRMVGMLFLSPLVFMWIASGFHAYPMALRLWLFLTPAVVLCIAIGIMEVSRYLWSRPSVYLKASAWGVVVALLYGSVSTAVSLTLAPRHIEEMRPVAAYYARHKKSSDQTYVYYAAVAPFRYYTERLGIADRVQTIQGVMARDTWQEYKKDLEQLQGKSRVWVIFSHVIVGMVNHDGSTQHEEQYMTEVLNSMGRRIDTYKTKGASVYLYDLEQP